jgi:hypothetical protein
MADFYAAKGTWWPTWGGTPTGTVAAEIAALAIDYVRVWQRPDAPGTSLWPRNWGKAGTRGVSAASTAAGASRRLIAGQRGPAAAVPPPRPVPGSHGGIVNATTYGEHQQTGAGSTGRVPPADDGVCYVDLHVTMDLTGPCEGVQLTTLPGGAAAGADGGGGPPTGVEAVWVQRSSA